MTVKKNIFVTLLIVYCTVQMFFFCNIVCNKCLSFSCLLPRLFCNIVNLSFTKVLVSVALFVTKYCNLIIYKVTNNIFYKCLCYKGFCFCYAVYTGELRPGVLAPLSFNSIDSGPLTKRTLY